MRDLLLLTKLVFRCGVHWQDLHLNVDNIDKNENVIKINMICLLFYITFNTNNISLTQFYFILQNL